MTASKCCYAKQNDSSLVSQQFNLCILAIAVNSSLQRLKAGAQEQSQQNMCTLHIVTQCCCATQGASSLVSLQLLLFIIALNTGLQCSKTGAQCAQVHRTPAAALQKSSRIVVQCCYARQQPCVTAKPMVLCVMPVWQDCFASTCICTGSTACSEQLLATLLHRCTTHTFLHGGLRLAIGQTASIELLKSPLAAQHAG